MKGGTTTNLFVHLRDTHLDLHKEVTQGKTNTSKGQEPAATQHTLTAIIEKGRQYDPKSLPTKELDCVVTYYIAKDMQPYSIVTSAGFRTLVSKLNLRYKLPSQKYFTQQEIPSLYTSVKESTVKPKLAEIDFFTVTTDLWTSRAAHPYLSCTVHFIDRS